MTRPTSVSGEVSITLGPQTPATGEMAVAAGGARADRRSGRVRAWRNEDELRVALRRVRRESKSPQLLLLGAVAGVAWLLALMADRQGWPDWSLVSLFLLGWIVFGAAATVAHRRGTKLARELDLDCPHCRAPLLSYGGAFWPPRAIRRTRAIEGGYCPKCGSDLFDSLGSGE